MKKSIIAAMAVFAFGLTNAQNVKYGAKAALNISSFTGGVGNQTSFIGYQIGGFAEIKISEKFAVQPEIMYSTQGSKKNKIENISGANYELDLVYELDYIIIPVMAKLYAAKAFNIEAGLQFGFLTDSKLSIEALGETTEFEHEDLLETFDFGINLGAGYDITKNISTGVRYNFGITNINKDTNDDIKNGVLSVSLGYKF